jgi:methylase of polypeptide subunit release factors
MNQKQALQNNIEAIRAVFKWHEGLTLSEEEVETMLSFKGWGFVKALLYNPYNDQEWITVAEGDKQLRPVIQQLHDLLQDKLSEKAYKEVVASIKAAVLDAYYTPAVVVDTFMEIVQEYADIKTVYDPAAGGGVFALSAIQNIENLQKVTMYEKDMLTSKVLECVMSTLPAKSRYTVHNKGFEESDKSEDGQYDLVATNPPYGSFPVFDPTIADKNLTGKVHNYFFAKGISKLNHGGLLAYLVTNAFLDTPTNRTARKYLFSNCDFISLTVMPDNLMKESANTEAPSHFLVVRRRFDKTEADMSEEEQLLCESSVQDIQGIKVAINSYINSIHKTDNPDKNITVATSVKPGKNQYGKPAVETWWDGPIDEIKEPFADILRRDFNQRYGLSKKWLDTSGESDIIDEPAPWDTTEDIVDPWIKAHIIVATIPKIEETAVSTEKSEDITGTCISCGVGMFGSELFCSNCYDENVMSDPSYYPKGDSWSEKLKETGFDKSDTGHSYKMPVEGSVYTDEKEDTLLEQMQQLVGIPEKLITSSRWVEDEVTFSQAGLTVANIVDKCDKEILQPADNQSVITENTTSTLTGESLQLLCNNPALEYKIGTIISVTTGNQQNLFEEKTQLYIITATDDQGKPTVAELVTDIKEGREQRILEAYANIRDYYYELQKEEQ